MPRALTPPLSLSLSLSFVRILSRRWKSSFCSILQILFLAISFVHDLTPINRKCRSHIDSNDVVVMTRKMRNCPAFLLLLDSQLRDERDRKIFAKRRANKIPKRFIEGGNRSPLLPEPWGPSNSVQWQSRPIPSIAADPTHAPTQSHTTNRLRCRPRQTFRLQLCAPDAEWCKYLMVV